MFQRILIFVLMFLICGCSMFNWTDTPLCVQTSEPDAKIYINGRYMGDGSIQTKVPRHTYVSVTAKKEGFKTAEREIAYTPGTVGAIDIIGGFIWYVPYIGLFFSGAYKLAEDDICILMEKE